MTLACGGCTQNSPTGYLFCCSKMGLGAVEHKVLHVCCIHVAYSISEYSSLGSHMTPIRLVAALLLLAVAQ